MSTSEARVDMSIDLPGSGYVPDIECLPDSELQNFRVVLLFVCLSLVNFVVLLGNIMVITAVCTSAKLRGYVTNNFIASLAASDLMLGMLVLPFSATKEVVQGWVFGEIWCSIYLAIDVWLTTASILNLCAISIDRYIAISRPFKYHYLMSPLRSKLLIAFVWIFAFVVCFPPLIGWNEDRRLVVLPEDNNVSDSSGSVSPYEYSTINVSTSLKKKNNSFCEDGIILTKCELTSDPGYIIYSAIGSFYIPMFVLIFFYWRIYRIAARTTKALKDGVLTSKAGDLHSNSGEKAAVTLRIHRGGGGSLKTKPTHYQAKTHGPIIRETSLRGNKSRLPQMTSWRSSSNNGGSQYLNNVNRNVLNNSKWCRVKHAHNGGHLKTLTHVRGSKNGRVKNNENSTIYAEPSCVTEDSQHTLLVKISKKNVKSQLKRINKETKAAKTVAIIIGCFILCWLPFFTIYLMGAFCPGCIPPMMFSVFFWLGYCNSAINPFVYAYFSRDFRFAFKRLLCLHCLQSKYSPRRGYPPTGTGSFRIPMTSRYSDSDSDPKD